MDAVTSGGDGYERKDNYDTIKTIFRTVIPLLILNTHRRQRHMSSNGRCLFSRGCGVPARASFPFGHMKPSVTFTLESRCRTGRRHKTPDFTHRPPSLDFDIYHDSLSAAFDMRLQLQPDHEEDMTELNEIKFSLDKDHWQWNRRSVLWTCRREPSPSAFLTQSISRRSRAR